MCSRLSPRSKGYRVPSKSPDAASAQRPSMDKPNRAVICARVSTNRQAENNSLPSQLAEMRAYCERLGMTVVAEIVDDVSGTVPIRQRPGGTELYKFIDGRMADHVVFHTLDRVTRDEHLIEINVIRRDVDQAGLKLHYAQEGRIADMSIMGGVMDTMRAAGAAEERLKIKERSIRGRRAKATAGKWVGQGNPSFGYDKIGNGKDARLEINKSEAATVTRIFELFLGRGGKQPMGIRKMTELFTDEGVPTPIASNVRKAKAHKHKGIAWHQRTIHMILSRRMYAGFLTYRDIEVPAPELAIIDPDTFAQAQARLRHNLETAKRNRKRDYLLVGHIRCTCGRAMIGKNKTASFQYYHCAGRTLPKHLRDCDERFINAQSLEGLAWDWLARVLTDVDELAKALDESERDAGQAIQPKRDRLATVAAEVERTHARINRNVSLYDDADDAELSALRDKVKAMAAQLKALQAERERLQAEVEQGAPSAALRADILAAAEIYAAIIPEADYAARRFILERFRVMCRLRRDDDGELHADISLRLNESEGHNNLVAIATNSPRNAPPAKRARRCDTRPAPRTPDNPST
jgi:site-specific DNA recombinase